MSRVWGLRRRVPAISAPWILLAVTLGLLFLATACSGTARARLLARPTPLPTATPHPRDVAPPGAQLTPYSVQRIVLDTLPFPANTLAIGTMTTSYNGDGTWTAQAEIAERTPDPAVTGDPAGRPELVSTHFVWTVSDRDRSILALNDEGQRWMAEHWHPGP